MPPPVGSMRGKEENYNGRKNDQKWWPIFVLPTFAAFVIGFLWPFIWGIYLSFCKFTTVNDVTFVGFSNYSKILLDNTFSHSFWLTVVFAFCFQYSDQCAGIFHRTGTHQGIQRNQCIPYRILYAEPDRWYRTWIYLADAVKRTALQMGTAFAFTFCKKRIHRYADSSDVAADRIYDDHLHSRSEQRFS